VSIAFSGGGMLWNRTYRGPGIEEGLSALAMGDGGYTVAGVAVSFDPYNPDIYLVRVAPCPVPSSISCSVSANTTIAGEVVAVTGTVTPCVPHRDVTLTYSLPDGTTLKRTVKTDSASFFRDDYAPDIPGSWGVAASIEGDVYLDASTSEPATFTVEAPQGGVPPYLYGSLIAVAAIAVLAALLLRRR